MLTNAEIEQIRDLFDTAKMLYANSKRGFDEVQVIAEIDNIKAKCELLKKSLVSQEESV